MKTEILKKEEELREAMLTNNIELLDKLIDNELIFTAPNGEIVTKEIDLNVHKNKIQTTTELTPSEQNIHIKDDLAIVTVKMKIKGSYSGIDISGNYRYLRVWKKKNNHWKIVAGSVTQIHD